MKFIENAQFIRFVRIFFSDFTGRLLEEASKSLPNLESLSVHWETTESKDLEMLSNIENGEKIYFKNLKTLTLSLFR